jgi:predicted RNA-binding protein with RPS1 domain
MPEPDRIVEGADVPIVKLTPLKKRKVSPKSYRKLKANLMAVGLIEPLCVCREGDSYFILDGFIRYQVFLELGIETVPCLVLDSKDIYTPNRQVNNLSPKEEVRMLRKALENLDEKTIAEAFGMESISTRLHTGMYKELHPKVLAALEEEKLFLHTAKEMTFVSPARQVEILRLMDTSGDWSLSFAKAQVLKTPQAQRSKKKRKKNPWDVSAKKKKDLANKLASVEKSYDFYSTLYRQYVGDLLKLTIYARQVINRSNLLEYLDANYPEAVRLFNEVLAESEGKEAG